jgi:thiol-disulfide isomerase/thioredoxin
LAHNRNKMKQFALIICVLLVGCKTPKTDFIVKMTNQDGYWKFIPGRVILWPVTDSLNYRNVPKDIEEFVVRKMVLQSDQYIWNQYLNGKIDKSQIENYIEQNNFDTTKLSRQNIKCEVLLLIGTKSNRRVIIVDSNNNLDFGDDKVLEYPYPLSIDEQKRIEDSLPSVLTHYEYFENNKTLIREVKIQPSPYKGALGLSFNTTDQIEKKYFLFASISEYKKGNLNLRGSNLEIYLTNGFSRVDFHLDKVSLFITDKPDSLQPEIEGNIPYKIGDVFNVKGRDYLIDSISNWGDNLFIKYLGKNTKPIGFTEGFFMPKFEAKRLDNSAFELNQHPQKYILLDFWGTWCTPCIKLIPELKKLNSKFSSEKFVLVSIAFDSDPHYVADFVNKESMNWEQIYVNQNQKSKNSLIEKLKITSFPTTILIDPAGKIIARNKSIDQLIEILNKKINAL